MSNEYLELISLNVWHMFATVGNLLILTWIVKKFLFDRVKKVLAERQSQVDGLYHDAEEAKDAALKDKGVLVRHFTSARICQYNRITVGTMAEMETLVAKIDEIFSEKGV